MRPIVVPVNFSSCAHNAALYAADLARAVRSDLHLIHIIQVPVTSAEIAMTESVYQAMLDAANDSLQELQSELRKRTGEEIRIDIHLETGSVAWQVKNLCNELNSAFVVLGISPPTFEKFIVGSPVSSLIRLPYPVLVVPEPAAFQRFQHIVLACDSGDIISDIPGAWPVLEDLRQIFNTRFDIVSVGAHQDPAEQERFQSGIREKHFQGFHPAIHFVSSPHVGEGLQEYLDHHRADLVIMFPKKHHFYEFHSSESRPFTKHSHVPVMSLHE